MDMETRLRDVREDIVSRMAKRDMLRDLIKETEYERDTLAKRSQHLSDGVVLIQKFSEGIQSIVVKRFEDLLTKGVRQIFAKDYKIGIEFTTSSNTLNADFFATLPDGKIVNLAKGEGGGLRDLVAVLQRMLYLVLEPTRPAKFLFLDENLKYLDKGRAGPAFQFLSEVMEQLRIQTVWITHMAAAGDVEADGFKMISIGGGSDETSDGA